MKKWMKAIITVILTVSAVCLVFVTPCLVYGQSGEDAVTLSLEYGFHDNIKTGSCFPLRVTMTNAGDDFDGTLNVRVPVRSDNSNVSASVFMNEGQWGSSDDKVYTYQKKISLGKGETTTEILYLAAPIFEGSITAELTDGVQTIAEEVIDYNFVENSSRILIGIVGEERENDLDGMSVTLDGGYYAEMFVKTIFLAPEEIYANPEALEQLDILITQDDTVFTQRQEWALKIWESEGGFHLKAEANASLKACFQSFVNGEQKAAFDQHLEEMQTYSLDSDATLRAIPVSGRPSMGKFVLILIIYAGVSGPGLYFILRKKGRQKYLWTGICVSSLFFTLLIGLLGKSTNIYAPFISYSGLYEQKDGIWTENVQFGIQAPYNGKYHLHVDKEYRLLPLCAGQSGSSEVNEETVSQIAIQMGENLNKITIEHTSSFTMNSFLMNRNKVLDEAGQIQIALSADGEKITGTWTNPTGYTIKNAVIFLKNRVAVLGEMGAGETGSLKDCKIYTCGNSGMEKFLKANLDFSEYEYPEYDRENLSNKIWETQYTRGADNGQAYVMGIVENPDLTFQLDSGYKIHGSAVFKMPVEINWSKDNIVWCHNLETYGVTTDNNTDMQTNLMFKKEETVDYPLGSLGKIREVTFSDVDYDDEKYFFPFIGKVAFYDWTAQNFEEILNWKGTFTGEQLEKYLSPDKELRVKYILDDSMDIVNRSCMLPCIKASGEVE